MKKLANKVAVIYGDGATGSAIAKKFAREGANVFFTGRTTSKLKTLADEILSGGGTIETARLDALDEQAVEAHMEDVIGKAGRIDISYNAIGIPQTGVQGVTLTQLSLEGFLRPFTIYPQAHFITTKAAAKRMIGQGSGVMIMQTPTPSRISQPFMGGIGPTWAALEALYRSLSVEYGRYGVRSVCLHTTAVPETPLIDEVYEIHGSSHGTSYEQFNAVMEGRTHRGRLTTLDELTNAAVFVASDEGSAITGTILNLTAGMIVE
ncbi:SDR family oxidoreductase [Puia sp.]|uniref:SDR family NAD(P)-dependent oxidoreductase n=1 Tax=Puia sp. TaxID=2045100 RepID=UPI002F409100